MSNNNFIVNDYAMASRCTYPFGCQSAVVQVKDGFLSQIYVFEEIVWERGPFESADDAAEAARAHVKKRARKVFA